MEKINLTAKEWQCAEKVLNEFSYHTDCLRNGQLTVEPKYIVCMDDDASSAFYAAKVYFACKKQYKHEPLVLCVGGKGMLSKYLNYDGCSEGEKLAHVCRRLGVKRVMVLDKGNNTGANVKEIIENTEKGAPIIFCPTKHLSLRLERTVKFSTTQFPGTEPLNAWFYVAPETLKDMLQAHNGKGLAGGLALLSELASIYERLRRYKNIFNAPLEKKPSQEGVEAAAYLEKHYPIKIKRLPLSAPIQFVKMYWAVMTGKKAVQEDLEKHVEEWHTRVEEGL